MRGTPPTTAEAQIGANVLAVMEAKGIKRTWLAEAVGLKAPSLGRRLRGEANFSAHEILLVAHALNVPEARLLAGVTSRSAGDSGNHSVSSAPESPLPGESESRARMDRPATRDAHGGL